MPALHLWRDVVAQPFFAPLNDLYIFGFQPHLFIEFAVERLLSSLALTHAALRELPGILTQPLSPKQLSQPIADDNSHVRAKTILINHGVIPSLNYLSGLIIAQSIKASSFPLSLSYIIAILRQRLIILLTETGMLMALAIFDLDNTLLAGDSDHSWGQFLVAQGRVDQGHYQTMNDRFYADYEAGCLDIHAYLEFSLAPLAALSASDLEKLHLVFMQQVIAPMRLALADRLIEKHRAAGDRLLVITSTNRFIVEPICQSLGLNEILATVPEMVDGHYTGKITGIPTYQEGKVECLDLWLRANNESMEGSYFYSDSINDMPLLLKVASPVAVDPDPELRLEALNRDWEIISLR